MKVFISVDIEGVACVVHREDGKLEGVEYERARKFMTEEANAAIDGAKDAGATEIVIADSHGHMRNLLVEELRKDVQVIRGAPRPLGMVHGVDDSFDAVFFVGYHSMEGTERGVLAHTYSGLTIYELRLNGITVGESGLNAAIAGHYGVPVALVCGDDTLEAEVGKLLPWTERVITKWGINFYSARNLTPAMSQERIRAGAKKALERLSEMKPFALDKPVRMEVEMKRALYADLAANIPGLERIDGRTLAYTGKDMLEVALVWKLINNTSAGA